MAHAHADLPKTAANYVPLDPVGFLAKAAAVFPDHPAVVYGAVRRTWAETDARCRRLASALVRAGLNPGETVAVVATNTPELYEAHFGVPMAGGVLNAINCRLDARTSRSRRGCRLHARRRWSRPPAARSPPGAGPGRRPGCPCARRGPRS
jgi:fatty-acyl-CoA synthase